MVAKYDAHLVQPECVCTRAPGHKMRPRPGRAASWIQAFHGDATLIWSIPQRFAESESPSKAFPIPLPCDFELPGGGVLLLLKLRM
jgi:hypothetical protein